ncbi:T9SS type A sorting domain-containing protein [Weeksella virosa]|uniref:T9SS type A sorting domain-containing protein n=1 Tax=Weeksella virosa TaxID=1014 RepID=UPI000E02D8CC|nr:T9SS type A sorting domain-containing protein [Weeksella virosa]MDK7675498.1 T9SS type A sorting domain-containing protein [Weeksella virosa]SUP54468.1 Por secretion system C-terminal sorting domain [Weeksella virosa]
MKKSLLSIFVASLCIYLNAQQPVANNTIIGNVGNQPGVKVFVKKNTLMYYGDGLKVIGDDSKAVVENNGNIHINLSSVKQGVNSGAAVQYAFYNYNKRGLVDQNVTDSDFSTGANFVNRYESKNSYGQLIFTNNNISSSSVENPDAGSSVINGRVTMEQPFVSPSDFDWLPISVPFSKGSKIKAETYKDILVNSFTGYGFSASDYIMYPDVMGNSRYSSTVMRWNPTKYYYETLLKSGGVDNGNILSPTETIILSLRKGKLNTIFNSNATTNNRIGYKGNPFSMQGKFVIEAVKDNSIYKSNDTWTTWSKKVNPVNERYNSYIGESMTSIDNGESTTYGKNLINFGNPFTHNLDFSGLFVETESNKYVANQALYDKIVAVQKMGDQVKWSFSDGNLSPKTTVHAAPTNKKNRQWAGDKEALLLRPFEILTLKLNSAIQQTNELQMNFLDGSGYWQAGYKTFNYSASANVTPNRSETGNEEKTSIDVDGFYQLGLQLTADDKSVQNHAYLLAIDQDVTGKNASFELDYGNFGTNSGIWFFQENKEGEYDSGSYKFINAFNVNDYVGKPLHVMFYKNPENPTNKFTFSVNLAEETTFNDNLDKFSQGNKFYFVDKKEEKAYEIDGAFTYSFTAEDSEAERFVIYWNQLPDGVLGNNDIAVDQKKTHVYSTSARENYIRFAKNNLKAEIQIYDLNGRLIIEKQNVNTSQDYRISNNLLNTVYFIKINYNDGTKEQLKSLIK